jgi:LacI family transcriptional regulator
MDQLPKAFRIKELIKGKLAQGYFGKPGVSFLSVRELSREYAVSQVTAHKILSQLREDGVVRLGNNRYEIADIAQSHSPQKQEAKRLRKIGMIVTDPTNPFFAGLIKDVVSIASKMNTEISLAFSNYSTDKEAKCLEIFHESQVDGILAVPGVSEKTASIYKELRVPYVMMVRKPVANALADSIIVHNLKGGEMAAEYLFSLGFRSFAYVGPGMLENDERLAGFKLRIEAEGCRLDDASIMKYQEWNLDVAQARMEEFVAGLPAPTGLFCFHDLVAIRALRACSTCGRRIPDDIAVVGFDDLPLASVAHPSLTTFRYPLADIARLSLNLLFDRIDGVDLGIPKTIYLEPELMVRHSTDSSAVVEDCTATERFSRYCGM